MTKDSNIKWLKIADLLYLTFINRHFQELGHKFRQLWAMVCIYVSLAQYLKILRPYFICNILITTLIHSLVRSLDCNFSYLVIRGTKTNIGDIKHNLIIWNTSHILIVKTGWFHGINLHFIDSWLRVHFHQDHISFIPPSKYRLPSSLSQQKDTFVTIFKSNYPHMLWLVCRLNSKMVPRYLPLSVDTQYHFLS